jgi:hypothetical protein
LNGGASPTLSGHFSSTSMNIPTPRIHMMASAGHTRAWATPQLPFSHTSVPSSSTRRTTMAPTSYVDYVARPPLRPLPGQCPPMRFGVRSRGCAAVHERFLECSRCCDVTTRCCRRRDIGVVSTRRHAVSVRRWKRIESRRRTSHLSGHEDEIHGGSALRPRLERPRRPSPSDCAS